MRAGSALPPHYLLRTRLERLVAALVDRPELARMVAPSLGIIGDALALDPHAEAVTRDVRAALAVLSG